MHVQSITEPVIGCNFTAVSNFGVQGPVHLGGHANPSVQLERSPVEGLGALPHQPAPLMLTGFILLQGQQWVLHSTVHALRDGKAGAARQHGKHG